MMTRKRLHIQSLEWLSKLPLRHGQPAKARMCFKTVTAVSAVAGSEWVLPQAMAHDC